MANEEHLIILRQGVEAWNQWREGHPDITPDLAEADLTGAELKGVNLNDTILWDVKLDTAHLEGAQLMGAHLAGTNLRSANLDKANLSFAAWLEDAHLEGAHLVGANLTSAYLRRTHLNGAILESSNLMEAILLETDLKGADLSNCRIYGISAWKLQLDNDTKQTNLVITPENEPVITVDNLEVAQFVYLLLNNEKIRDVIDTITSKAVLILGRFTPERKAILDKLRDALRERDYVPILFDFDKPTNEDFTGTIKTLAGMCHFVIADITNPKSSPLELQATVPDYMIPFVPIIQEKEEPFAMFVDLWIRHREWVLEPLKYIAAEDLIAVLEEAIIQPAEQRYAELTLRKAQALMTRHTSQYRGNA